MTQRFQFGLRALLRSMFFAGLACGLLTIAYQLESFRDRPAAAASVFFLALLAAAASVGASVGSLFGRTRLAALAALVLFFLLPSQMFILLVELSGVMEVETVWLKLCMVVGPLTIFPATLLAIWRPRSAALLLAIGGLVSVVGGWLAWWLPFLVRSTPRMAAGGEFRGLEELDKSFLSLFLGMNFTLSLMMMGFGVWLIAYCLPRRLANLRSDWRSGWLGWLLIVAGAAPASLAVQGFFLRPPQLYLLAGVGLASLVPIGWGLSLILKTVPNRLDASFPGVAA